MSINCEISVNVELSVGDSTEPRSIAACSLLFDDADIEHDRMALADETKTKDEQMYVIAVLRDFADAMEYELNRPENTKKNMKLSLSH